LDTKGNIFGGFTSLKWESSYGLKADDSLKSFLFTLKNPHNIAAKRFGLKVEAKKSAIECNSKCGPIFGGSYGIFVSDDCNTDARSYTSLGRVYTNDTGLKGNIVFTGSWYFQVKEIEFFKITN
jgi:hypothetical protein